MIGAVSTYQIALLLHLTGVIVYFCGLAVAAMSFAAAGRRKSPREIAAILSLARAAVVLVGVGLVVLVAFGAWLVDLAGHDLGETWLTASFALLAASLVLGGAGGQRPKQARKLAATLAVGPDEMTPELRRLLHERLALALNVLAGALSVAVLVLMVWRPGS